MMRPRGMRVLVPLKNEWIKTRRRPGVWAVLAVTVFALILLYWGLSFSHTRMPELPPFSFPNAWALILGSGEGLVNFILATLLVLLIGSEFQWRTARQNAIDGMHRREWFLGKMLLLPFAAVLLLSLQVLVGGAFAALHTDWSTVETVMRPADVRLLVGSLLALFGYGSLALLCALATRSSGTAVGIFFLYTVAIEKLGGAAMTALGGQWSRAAVYLPIRVISDLQRPSRYGAGNAMSLQEALATIAEMQGQDPLSTERTVILAGLYSLGFLAVGWVAYRARDL